MKYFVFLFIFFTFQKSHASRFYMTESPTRVQQALEAEFGIGSGVGSRDGSCLLCHATSSGGPGNIPTVGFGRDFVDAANRLGISGNGSNLSATGSNSLQSIFAETTFQNQDADQDGLTNAEEYVLNSDPNDTATDSGGSGGGGGCGFIKLPNNNSTGGTSSLLMLIPLLLIFRFAKRSGYKKSQYQ